MNRRTLLVNGLKAAGAVALAAASRPFVSIGAANDPRSRERLATIRRMIAEMGTRWVASRDRSNGRNPALVYFGDGPAYELVYDGRKQWNIGYRELTSQEAKELDNYLASLRGHVSLNIGDRLWSDSDHMLRAWIKNGRLPNWVMSTERA